GPRNDTYGYDAGDDVLREFAIRLRKSIRGIDLACRYGGEEFVVVMPETESDVAATVAEGIRGQIANEPVPVRGGLSAINVTPEDRPGALLKRADQALFSAKRDGRNRVAGQAA